MIPTDWTPRHRDSDGELVGYLVPEGDLVVPTTIVGHAIGPASDPDEAGALLDWKGLPSLDRRFWTQWHDEGWVPVRIVEAAPARVRIRREIGSPAQLQQTVTLQNPAAEVLHHEPPT